MGLRMKKRIGKIKKRVNNIVLGNNEIIDRKRRRKKGQGKRKERLENENRREYEKKLAIKKFGE